MKKITLYIVFLFTICSCNKDYCNFIEKNEETLNKLLLLIEKNPDEFSNSQLKPKAYYTYNYQKKLSEFEQTKSSNNIDAEEYKALKEIFNELSIEKLMIYDNQNLLFKIENLDFFVSNYNVYVGFLKQLSIEEVKKDFEIMDYKKCMSDWYYLLERTSIAR